MIGSTCIRNQSLEVNGHHDCTNRFTPDLERYKLNAIINDAVVTRQCHDSLSQISNLT
jgi:hypothetical protein